MRDPGGLRAPFAPFAFTIALLCLLAGCTAARDDERVLQPSVLVAEEEASLPASALAGKTGASGSPRRDGRVLRPPANEAPALLWMAGRASLPGLSATRAASRRRESSMALDALRTALAGSQRRAWRSWLEALLESEDSPSWITAARAVGRLGLRELAAPLCPALAPGVTAERRLAARVALHELFGTWFESAKEVEPFLEAIDAPATEAFVARLAEEEARSTERLFALLEIEPVRARELLAAADPRVRTRAAERLGRALSKAELDPAVELGGLLAALAAESDEQAFHAEIEALLVPLGSLAADAELERLFEIFDEHVQQGWDERSLSVAQALARLAYPSEAKSRAAWLERALTLSGRILDGALLADALRGFEDSDAAVAVIGSLSELAARVSEQGGSETLASSRARVALLGVLRDPTRADSTRQAAGVALGLFVQVGEIALFDAELSRRDLPGGLALVLLGTLRELLAEAARGGQDEGEALRALEHVVLLSSSPDPDLRREALALFSDPRLEPLVRELDPSFLLHRLEREELAELRRSLIVLLGRFGNEGMFEPLLALPSFDRLAASEGALSSELDAALAELAGERPERLLEAARRLAAGADGGSAARLRRALSLVAHMEPAAARALNAADRETIVHWSWRLHALGVPLREAIDGDGRFVERLLAIHLAEPAAGAAEAQRQHLLAVLSGGTPEERALSAPEILGHFARAEASAREAGLPDAFGRLVRRDRARFRLEIGRSAEAFADYRALFLEDPAALEDSDLHRACDLALAASGPATERVTFAADVLFCLLARDAWAQERPVVRLDDLQELLDLVRQTGDSGYLTRYVALFESLPLTPGEAASTGSDPSASQPAPPATAIWRDLALDPSVLERLRELRRDALDDLAQAQAGLAR